jgi:hypothetical protein
MAKKAKRHNGAWRAHLVRSKSRCLMGRSREEAKPSDTSASGVVQNMGAYDGPFA